MNYEQIIENYLSKATKKQIEQGKNWYYELNDFCHTMASTFEIPVYKVAAIISILSPLTSFSNNVRDTYVLLMDGKGAKLKSPLFKKKALTCLGLNEYQEIASLFSEKTGRKTLSFFENLMLQGDRATIDSHMGKMFVGKTRVTNKEYREIEKAIQDYALKVNLKPFELQAILWVAIRGKAF
jgi:hypothetical protein